MYYYIWLKKGATKTIEKLVGKEVFGDFRIERDRGSGKSYISSHDDPISPSTQFAEIPEDLIEKVTIQNRRIDKGFRKEGIYHHEGAILMVINRKYVDSGGIHSQTIKVDTWQEISASAPTIQKLKLAYGKLRKGELNLDENWDKELCEIEREEEIKKAGEEQKI
ncbi:MAG: hypothetical protein ABIH51_00300 [Patescibacteria group bacterium]